MNLWRGLASKDKSHRAARIVMRGSGRGQIQIATVLCVLVLVSALVSMVYDAQIVRTATIVSSGMFGAALALIIIGRGTIPATMILLGLSAVIISTIMSSGLVLTIDDPKPHIFWWDPAPQKERALEQFPAWGKFWTMATGALCLTLGMILACRPGILYVRNRLPFEYPYAVWKSGAREMIVNDAELVPLQSLLTYRERILISRYRMILVIINGKKYMAEKNEMVPQDCIIVKSADGKSLCGV